MQQLLKLFTASILLCNSNLIFAGDVNTITTGKNANGSFEVQIGGTNLGKPSSYSLNNPARIVVDIHKSKSNLKKRIFKVSNPLISNIAVIGGDDRVRATINMPKLSPYVIVNTKNKISIVIKSGFKPQQKKKQPDSD